jgi:hypothetical protein
MLATLAACRQQQQDVDLMLASAARCPLPRCMLHARQGTSCGSLVDSYSCCWQVFAALHPPWFTLAAAHPLAESAASASRATHRQANLFVDTGHGVEAHTWIFGSLPHGVLQGSRRGRGKSRARGKGRAAIIRPIRRQLLRVTHPRYATILSTGAPVSGSSFLAAFLSSPASSPSH